MPLPVRKEPPPAPHPRPSDAPSREGCLLNPLRSLSPVSPSGTVVLPPKAGRRVPEIVLTDTAQLPMQRPE